MRTVWLRLLLSCSFLSLSLFALAAGMLPPREIDLPVNGTNLTEDPAAVAAQFSLPKRQANKIVEMGDTTALTGDPLRYVETPHVDWAAPYANGPVRVLWIGDPGHRLREAIELMQRSDFAITILQVPNILPSFGKETAMRAFFRGKMAELLKRDYDVIVVTSAAFSEETWLLESIVARVQDGCGVVAVHDLSQWWRGDKGKLELFHALSPLSYGYGGQKAVPTRKTAHPVTEGVPFLLWPATSVHNSVLDKDATALAVINNAPIIAAGQCGKGRAVGVYFTSWSFNGGIIPAPLDPAEGALWGDYYEPVYACWLKALAWAAKKEPKVTVNAPEVAPCTAGETPKLTLGLYDQRPQSGKLSLRFRLQDPYGQEIPGKIVVRPGSSTERLDIELPALAINGLHRLDYWVLRGKAVENFGSVALKVDNGVPFAVEALQSVGALGGTAKYRVKTGGAAGTLAVRGIDDAERVFLDRQLPVTDGQTVEVDLSRSLLPRNHLEFTLLQNGKATGRANARLYIPRIGLDALRGEYCIASYGWTDTPDYLAPYMGDLYRAAGFNTIYANWHSRGYISNAANLGLFSITGAMSPYVKQSTLDKELASCPNKAKTQAEWTKNITAAKDDIRYYGGIGRVLDDEAFIAYTAYKDGEMRGAQACQCPDCLAEFRGKMREKYKTIAALNAAWDTTFASFDEMKPLDEDAIRDKANPAGWLEFRQYMNWVYANKYYGWMQGQHAELSPSYGVGAGAPGWTSREGGPTYRGGDLSTLKPTLKFLMAYGGGAESQNLPGAFVGQPGGQKYDPPLQWQQWQPWYELFHGADALWFYYGSAIIGNELAWRKHAEWVLQGVRDIRDGAGPLLRDATPLDKQVRILYSSENMAMQWLNAKRKDVQKNLGKDLTTGTLRSLCRDFLTIQPSYIMADDIKGGGLRDCKLLLLPLATNMDDATAAAVKAFVSNGGFVLADVLPATRELYGKPRAKSPLLDLFGVEDTGGSFHCESEVWYSIGMYDFTPDGKPLKDILTWLPANTWQLGLKATTASTLGMALSKEAKEAPACFLNSYGKGKALLLNFVYRDLNQDTFGWHLLFGNALQRLSGVQSPARLLDPATGAPLSYRPLYTFRYGPATLLGSIRGYSIWSGDGPVLMDPARAVDMSDLATFKWEGKQHAYNVRARKYLGYGDAATIDLPSFEGRLLALLPYQVTGVKLTAAPRVKAGENLALTAQVTTGGPPPGDHLLRLEAYSPTGHAVLLYARTLTAPGGKAECTIPFAFNDRPGKWKIVVRDVLTGVEGQHALQVD
ncbi:MAG: beta-galactosidase [Armatimonadota bacterium]